MLDKEKPIGFGNIMVFGPVCWIGNIVVSGNHRKKGYGTNITRYLIQQGETLGARTFNLVATELGESIYRKLGFNTEFMYEFFRLSDKLPRMEISPMIRDAYLSDLSEIIDLDNRNTGESRGEIIERFMDNIHVMVIRNRMSGYLIGDLGDGLIVAENPESGIELLKLKIKSNNSQVVVPEMNKRARSFLLGNGFVKTMELPRMTSGDKQDWKPGCIYSRGTGYCG